MKKKPNYRIERNFAIVGFFIFFLVILLLLFYLVYFPVMKFNPKITYTHLNSTQLAEAKLMIDSLKPEYKNLCRSITFVNDSNDLENSGWFSKFHIDNKTEGYNQHKAVYMIVSGDLEWDKEVLEHEILHNILPRGNEEYAYDLMNYNLVYKESTITITLKAL